MLEFLSKFLPIFIYPLGLACVLLAAVLLTRRWPRWQRILAVLALVILWLAGNHYVAAGLARSLEWRYLPSEQLPHAHVIVVLGGGTQPAEAPRPMVEINGAGDRVIYAAWLYQQGAADYLLLSGGRIPWRETSLSEDDTPAAEMAVLLEMLNVPSEVIWQENQSHNTYQNALFSKRILEEQGIDRIILVTSAMHMPRAVKFFEAQGLTVIPAPVDYVVTRSDLNRLSDTSLQTHILRLFPGADNLALTTRAMKEYIGNLYYNLRGWD